MSVDALASVLEPILTQAIARSHFEKGNIQVLDETSGFLTIKAQTGFDNSFLKTFMIVKANDGCACGRAIRLRLPVLVNDVMSDDDYLPFRQAALSAGYRSVLSVPLITTAGHLLGVISVHHSVPQTFDVDTADRATHLKDLAEFAAAAIHRHLSPDQRAARISADSVRP